MESCNRASALTYFVYDWNISIQTRMVARMDSPSQASCPRSLQRPLSIRYELDTSCRWDLAQYGPGSSSRL